MLVVAPDISYETKNSNVIHLLEVVNNLERYCDVYLIARGKINNNSSDNIYLVKEFLDIHPFRGLTRSITSLVIGFNLIRKRNIDIIYERHHVFDIGIILSKVFKIPCVLEVNGILIDEVKVSGSYGPTLQKAVYLIENLLIRHANCIIAVTPGIKDDFVKRGIDKKKVHVIPNGANIDLFKPINRDKSAECIGLDKKYKYICFVGNLAPWQGVEYLIKSTSMILKRCPDVRFLIVGNGTMQGDLEALAEELGVPDKFIFTGVIPYEKVPLYINASDLCVAPFIVARNAKIGLSPLKIYEYLACGKPVVASDIPGVSDILKKSCGGIVVTPEAPRELADVIIKMLGNKDLLEEMGSNSRKYVVKNHSWSAVAERIVTLCGDVIKVQKK